VEVRVNREESVGSNHAGPGAIRLRRAQARPSNARRIGDGLIRNYSFLVAPPGHRPIALSALHQNRHSQGCQERGKGVLIVVAADGHV
jgi:hypothetical protein